MGTEETILAFIRLRGPSLPATIAREIKQDLMFASAHLSELKAKGRLKISFLKVGGGSPLYFLPGQESMLQNFVENLGDKQRKAYEYLKEKKVLRDSALVPVFRQALRTIKDFAFPLNVTFNSKQELFWSWYLTQKEEAEKLIKMILAVKEELPEEKETKKEQTNQPDKEIAAESEKGRITQVQKEPQRHHKEQQKTIFKEEQSTQKETPKEPQKDTQKENQKQTQENPPEKKEEKETKEKKEKGEFYAEIKEYFNKNKIKIIEETTLKKSAELEFIVLVPSPVGELKYFVKAKSKKKINEGDLSTVFIQSQSKRLPVLFLGKGDLTKKAQETLDTEFKGMKYNKI